MVSRGICGPCWTTNQAEPLSSRTDSQVVAKFATNPEEAMNEFLFTIHRFHERECLCYGEIFPELRLREVPIRYYQEVCHTSPLANKLIAYNHV
jgi:hypothetical protein